jgi:hypothetical protein
MQMQFSVQMDFFSVYAAVPPHLVGAQALHHINDVEAKLLRPGIRVIGLQHMSITLFHV